MRNGVSPDLFLGKWTGLTFDGDLEIGDGGGMFTANEKGRTYSALRFDKWKNLSGENLCFSLHTGASRLFGIENLDNAVPYSVFAAARNVTMPISQSPCGEDDPLFAKLLDKTLRVKAMKSNGPAPFERCDTIEIRRSCGHCEGEHCADKHCADEHCADEHCADELCADEHYDIGTISAGVFVPFDHLCPDSANGTLNSRRRSDDDLLRNVTSWDNGCPPLKVFGMLTMPARVLRRIRQELSNHSLPELAQRYRLALFELEALLSQDLDVADPLLIWGADDGG